MTRPSSRRSRSSRRSPCPRAHDPRRSRAVAAADRRHRSADRAVRLPGAVDHVELRAARQPSSSALLPTSVPVITFNVVSRPGSNRDLRRLREVAERILRPAIVRVPGVGGARGGRSRVRQIQLVIHPAELAALHVTPQQLAQKIEADDQVIAAGRVWDEHQTLPVVYNAQAADLDQLRALPIATGPDRPGATVRGRRCADGNEDPDVIIAGARGEAVVVSVARLPGASTPAVVDGVRARSPDCAPATPCRPTSTSCRSTIRPTWSISRWPACATRSCSASRCR